MKVNTDGILEQIEKTIAYTRKEPTMNTPFADLLKDLVERSAEGKTSLELHDREQLVALTEMMSLQLSYSVMKSLGSMNQEQDESNNGPFFSPFASMPGTGPSDNISLQTRQPLLPRRNGAEDRTAFDSIIDKASRTYGVDRDLISSVIDAESGYDPDATSPKGAMGLMQLMPDTARGLGVKDAYDPEQNIMGGTRFLKYLLDRYDGNVPRALAAYNWGMGNVERSTTGRLPEETRGYIAKIMRSLQRDSV